MTMRYIRSFTLTELCVQHIIEHLDLFIYNKDGLIPQKHIEFLFRLYSKECFCEYTSSHTKTEECLLWFLSAPNKNVFLSDITQNIIKRLQIVGSAITSLTLQETMATENVLNSVICCVPHLSYLDLSDTSCSDKTLLCIQKMCPHLVTLNVQNCENVTDDGMLNLCGNNLSLKNLNIFNTSVEYAGLHDILEGMPSLQCLSYDNMADSFYYTYESDVHSCIQKNIKYNLTELIYEELCFAENPKKVIWIWTVLCPNVNKIHILFPVRHDVLEMCSRFSYLKELKFQPKNNFENINIPDPLVPFLSIANNLTTLILSYVKIPSIILIECFKNVKNLQLKNVSFTDFNEDDIKSKSTNLHSLTLKYLHLSMTDVKFIVLLISLSKNVAELVISHMDYLLDEIVDIILKSMQNLSFIEFSFIRTRLPSSFRKFFEIPTVKQVYLDGCVAEFGEMPIGPAHVSPHSCTLSWRTMTDTCYSDDDDDFESDAMNEF